MRPTFEALVWTDCARRATVLLGNTSAGGTVLATSIKLDPVLKARIDAVAKAARRSAHWIMREAIREYVERAEQRDLGRKQPWASFQDRAQEEIPPANELERHVDAKEALRRWSEATTPLEKFMALAGAGAATSTFKSKQEIDDYVDWIRER